jgi:hypothetical protein
MSRNHENGWCKRGADTLIACVTRHAVLFARNVRQYMSCTLHSYRDVHSLEAV